MITYKVNALTLETYLFLREEVRFKNLSIKQAQMAIDNCLFNVVAFDGDMPVGMGRVVGDGAVICYIQDLVVIPGYQKFGIGGNLLDRCVSYVESITLEGTEMMLALMCAKGREGFYLKHNFIARPTDNLGPGMIKYISKKED